MADATKGQPARSSRKLPAWVKWIGLAALGLVALGLFFFLGPLVAVAAPLVVWRDWLGARTKLVGRVPALSSAKPAVLAVGLFLAVLLPWGGLVSAVGSGAGGTPTPAPSATVPAAAPAITRTPTETPIPLTTTPVPPTRTPTQVLPTATPRPSATPTLTPVPTPTATPEPTATVRKVQPGVKPVSKDDCPDSHPTKGNRGSNGNIYHVPGSRDYSRTDPEICFAEVQDAEAAGFRAPQN